MHMVRIIRCKNLALYIRDCESLCLSDQTLTAVGPFYLVSMPGKVKYPTQGVKIICNLSWTPHSNLEKDNSLKTTPVLAQRWAGSPNMGCLYKKKVKVVFI